MHYEYSADLKTRKLISEEGEVVATEPTSTDYPRGAKAIAAAAAVKLPMFKTPWNHDTDTASLATATAFPELGKAIQSQKEEADINTIVNRFLKTGELPNVPMPPRFADLGDEPLDFQTAMDQVNAARRSFDALPAKARAAFQNDPAKFMAYVDHCLETEDLDPLRELGLAVPRTPDPQETPPVAKAQAQGGDKAPGGDTPAPQGAKGPETGPK